MRFKLLQGFFTFGSGFEQKMGGAEIWIGSTGAPPRFELNRWPHGPVALDSRSKAARSAVGQEVL
jgi:hypothetical protein